MILTSYLSTMTKAQNLLNDVIDKYLVMTADNSRERGEMGPGGPRGKRRGGEGRMGMGFGFRGFDDESSRWIGRG